MEEQASTELDRWLALLDEAKLMREVEEKEARATALELKLRDEVAHLEDLRSDIRKARAALDFKRQLAPAPVSAPPVDATEQPARGREAIRALLAEMPDVIEWTNAKVLDELVRRGWADPSDSRAVGISLSRMERSGELVRPRKGIYQRPADIERDAPANLLELSPLPVRESGLI